LLKAGQERGIDFFFVIFARIYDNGLFWADFFGSI